MSPSALTPPPTTEQVTEALARVNDPEIRRPITELGMIKNVGIAQDGKVRVEVYLTVAGCPLRGSFEQQVQEHVKANLARFKVPREVSFLAVLPRNATGKVLKRELV